MKPTESKTSAQYKSDSDSRYARVVYEVSSAGTIQFSSEQCHNPETIRESASEKNHDALQTLRMPEHAKERIRVARDQNIQTLVTREAIDLVNRKSGLFDILNPFSVTLSSPSSCDSIFPAEQIWHLVELSAVAALYLEKEDLLLLAAQVRQQTMSENPFIAERLVVEKTYQEFHNRIEARKREILELSCPYLSVALDIAGYDEQVREVIIERTLQVRWLDKKIRQHVSTGITSTGMWNQIVEQELLDACSMDKSSGSRHVMELLDARLEVLFNLGVSQRLPEIVSIAFTRYPSEIDKNELVSEELPSYHPLRNELQNLDRRLCAGEQSAVGGGVYAEMRFSKETLNRVASGDIPAVLYDGDHQNGLLFVRKKFGRNSNDPALLDQVVVMDLQGTYGAFLKSWVIFRDGRSVLLVSYIGESRQLSNASALMLYRNEQGKSASADSFILAKDITTTRYRLKQDLAHVLTQEQQRLKGAAILGQFDLDPSTLPTQVLILQHPDQFKEALGDNLEIHELKSGCLGSVHIGYYRHPDGTITRLLIPKVGSTGLYGDTAGTFLKVVFEDNLIEHVNPDIFFTGTAGGFAKTNDLLSFRQKGIQGLPKMSVGSFFMPQDCVADSNGILPMQTVLDAAVENSESQIQLALKSCQLALQEAEIHKNSAHFSIAAPALETFELIDEIIDKGYSSIDVESGPIMRAVTQIQAQQPDVTFTPIYLYSDNPLEARDNPTATLAYGGPLSEGSKKVPGLYRAMHSLLELAHTVRKSQDNLTKLQRKAS
jgi:hypothetical protein